MENSLQEDTVWEGKKLPTQKEVGVVLQRQGIIETRWSIGTILNHDKTGIADKIAAIQKSLKRKRKEHIEAGGNGTVTYKDLSEAASVFSGQDGRHVHGLTERQEKKRGMIES